MAGPVKPLKRAYDAPRRAAAAARTREAIVTAAKDAFEALGWSGATMRGIAGHAGVSVKTVEALYGTKAGLLKTAIDYAIPGGPPQARPPAPPPPPHQPARRADRGGRRTSCPRPPRGSQARGPEPRQPPHRRPVGGGHPAQQARRAAPHQPALRRGRLLDRHRLRHLPQPHHRPRAQPSRLRNLDQELLPQHAPPLTPAVRQSGPAQPPPHG